MLRPATRAAASAAADRTVRAAPRWRQLVLGVLCMVMIANLQYGWTLFVGPIDQRFHWGRTAIQVAFTLFVVTETWLVPLEGWLVDRLGPRVVVAAGGVLVGTSWVMNARATSLATLYVAAVIGGAGAGAVYGTAMGNALKWFTDRRGLAAGLTAAGFGAGSALTVAPIARVIASSGYEVAFLKFGVLQGAAVIVLAAFVRAPRAGETPGAPAPAVLRQGGAREYGPVEALRSRTFWLMYAIFVMVASGGLMVIAELAPMARDFRVASVPVTIAGATVPALTLALSLDRVMNGVTRPFFGWVSDHVGRERTMCGAFLLEGGAILLLLRFAGDPVTFVALSGLVFFAWGEIYSLFPATAADVFGRRYCTTIYGMLYTAKGTAALLVPLFAWVSQRHGWVTVFATAAALDFAAAALAAVALPRARARVPEPAGALGIRASS